MRILVLGAGATGGYFGGRLLQAGRDVTFLVRPRRAALLAEKGLVIESKTGSVTLPNPPTIETSAIRELFDVILLSCKAYDLDSAIAAIEPAMGERSVILPLLNGMKHLDVLDAHFGRERVLGGSCRVVARLEESGIIRHYGDVHQIIAGERPDNGVTPKTDRMAAITQQFEGSHFLFRRSEEILLEMWEKWVFLATLAAGTCLMRGAIGDIVAAGGKPLIERILHECCSIAESSGWTPRPDVVRWAHGIVTAEGSEITASMFTDLENGSRTEADHILGDLLARKASLTTAEQMSLLEVAYVALKTSIARRQREEK